MVLNPIVLLSYNNLHSWNVKTQDCNANIAIGAAAAAAVAVFRVNVAPHARSSLMQAFILADVLVYYTQTQLRI